MIELCAWAAGLFEGEGYFTTVRTNSLHGRVSLRAGLEMTDEDTVRRFAAVVGVGSITRRDRALNRKPMFCWQVNAAEDFRLVVDLLSPWLGPRRLERAADLLAQRAEYESRIPAIRLRAAQRSGLARRRSA